MTVTKKKRKKRSNNQESKKLNLREELFCRLYTQNRSLFGNGTQCYAQAYGYELEKLSKESITGDPNEFGVTSIVALSPYEKACNTCAVMANTLLRKTKIDDRISQLLREMMTEESADTEMSYVMHQRIDLAAKNAAMREFNKLKGRITDKFKVTHEGLSLKDLYHAAKEEEKAENKK